MRSVKKLFDRRSRKMVLTELGALKLILSSQTRNWQAMTRADVLSRPFVGGLSAPRFEHWRAERGENI
jgi:hypothetical protein